MKVMFDVKHVRSRATAVIWSVSSLFFVSGCGTGSKPTTPVSSPSPNFVSVSGTHLLRDGAVWAPHGLNSVAFNAAPSARVGVFADAYNNFNAAEVAAMKTWGNDTIRFQVAQPGLDKEDTLLYDPAFLGEVVDGVRAARAAGLNVIVSVQDEKGSGEVSPTPLPDAGTGRAWTLLAQALKGDDGVMFELLNEPRPLVNNPVTGTSNWPAWADAMNNMVAIIRASGATNVVIADGLNLAHDLDDAPILADPLHQVAYASHPYFESAADQTQAGNGMPGVGWDAKFGKVSISSIAPVIVTEWSLESDATADGNATLQYCDANSNKASLSFLNYIQGKGIGLLGFAYDLPNTPTQPRDGRLTIDDKATPSTLLYTNCGEATFGPGTIIQNWYRTGIVPALLQ